MKTLGAVLLSSHERQALQEVATRLKQRFPIEHMILYGSKARGDADEYSDVDLLFVLSSRVNWKDEQAMVSTLFDLGMKYDLLFSSLRVSAEEWNGGIFTEFPIYQEILRDGAYIE